MYVNELLNKPRFSNGAVRTAWAIRRWPTTQQDSLAIKRWMVMEQNATFYTSFTYGSNFIRLIHTYIECTFKRLPFSSSDHFHMTCCHNERGKHYALRSMYSFVQNNYCKFWKDNKHATSQDEINDSHVLTSENIGLTTKLTIISCIRLFIMTLVSHGRTIDSFSLCISVDIGIGHTLRATIGTCHAYYYYLLLVVVVDS